jgi:hypothetical protein
VSRLEIEALLDQLGRPWPSDAGLSLLLAAAVIAEERA